MGDERGDVLVTHIDAAAPGRTGPGHGRVYIDSIYY